MSEEGWGGDCVDIEHESVDRVGELENWTGKKARGSTVRDVSGYKGEKGYRGSSQRDYDTLISMSRYPDELFKKNCSSLL